MKKLFISGIIVSIALLIGRISGFFREIFVASIFGVSVHSDITILLLTVSDLLVNLLVGGAFSMVLIPAFKSEPSRVANMLYLQSFIFSGILFFLISLLIGINAEYFVYLIAPGLSNFHEVDYIPYVRYVLLAIPLTVMAGVVTAYMQFKEKFSLPSFGTLFFNIVIIVSLIIYSKLNPTGNFLLYVTSGVIIGALLRLIIFYIASNSPRNLIPDLFKKNYISKAIFKQYIYCIISSASILLVPVIIRAISSTYGDGYLSISNYALKLVDLPLTVVLSVFSIIFLPKLSGINGVNDRKKFNIVISDLIFVILLLSSIISIIIYMFSDYIVSLVYGWGKISEEDILAISYILRIAIFSLIFQGINSILISAFAAKVDNKAPLIINSVVITIFAFSVYTLNLSLEWLFYSMNACFISISIIMLIVMKLKHKISLYSLVTKDKLLIITIFSLSSYSLYLLNKFLNINIWTAMLLSVLYLLLNGIFYLVIERKNFIGN